MALAEEAAAAQRGSSSGEGLEDVEEEVEDALQDPAVRSSSVSEDERLRGEEQRRPGKQQDVTDELALPEEESTPTLVAHR